MLLLNLIPSINFMFDNNFSQKNTVSANDIESKLDDVWTLINLRSG
jgi:hypothetical protein